MGAEGDGVTGGVYGRASRTPGTARCCSRSCAPRPRSPPWRSWAAPGAFYLGRDVPWTWASEPTDAAFVRAMETPSVNRVVTYSGKALAELEAAGFKVLATDGEATLLGR